MSSPSDLIPDVRYLVTVETMNGKTLNYLVTSVLDGKSTFMGTTHGDEGRLTLTLFSRKEGPEGTKRELLEKVGFNWSTVANYTMEIYTAGEKDD